MIMCTHTAYQMKVSTADKKHAGTGNNLYLMIVGEGGRSRELTIKNPQKSPFFQRGQTDTFQIGVRDVGGLRAVRVAHSGAGKGERWYLYQIVLVRLVDQRNFKFLVRCWVEESSRPNLSYVEIPLHTEQ